MGRIGTVSVSDPTQHHPTIKRIPQGSVADSKRRLFLQNVSGIASATATADYGEDARWRCKANGGDWASE